MANVKQNVESKDIADCIRFLLKLAYKVVPIE